MATAKITKLDEGVVMSHVSDRVKLIFNNRHYPEQKVILYIGFGDYETANRCFQYLIDKGMAGKYEHKTDRGVCKPRRAERTECEWELKIHRPDQALVDLFVAKAVAQVETKPAKPVKVETQQPTNDRVKVKPIQWDNDPYSED